MKHNYFLLSAMVIYQKDKLERSRNFNILLSSDKRIVTRAQLGRAQQQAQVRFFTEFDSDRKSEIMDVYIQSVSYLGEMTEAEFHEDFDYPGKPQPEPVEEPMADPAPEITETETLTETPVEDVTRDDGTDENGQTKDDRLAEAIRKQHYSEDGA